MPAVLLQLNRRTIALAAVQSALIAAAIGIAAPAGARAGARIMTGNHAIGLTAGVLVAAAVAGSRAIFAWLMLRLGPRERLLVIGATDASVSFARELLDRRLELGVDIVGFVDIETGAVKGAIDQPGVIGTIDDVPDIVRRRRVNRVIVSLADAQGRLPIDTLLELRRRGIPVDHLASVYERYTGKIALDSLRPSWLIVSAGFRQTRARAVAKRLLDLVAGASGLILAAPLMLVVAAAVKITSPGPIFYSQRRVGRNGRVFTIRKFRSMRVDAEAATGAVWAVANDPRLTPIGGLLRAARLDELPQLWNVLRNDMSLVGPRPERPEFVNNLEQEIRFYGQRHLVKPGLTGWAQISYRYGASVDDARRKLQYDLYYLKHMSIAMDIFIMLATAKTVWSRAGC